MSKKNDGDTIDEWVRIGTALEEINTKLGVLPKPKRWEYKWLNMSNAKSIDCLAGISEWEAVGYFNSTNYLLLKREIAP